MNYKLLIGAILVSCLSIGFYAETSQAIKKDKVSTAKKSFEVVKSEAEWKKLLSQLAYNVLREKGTEAAFSGKYNANHEKGTYYCAACGQSLFSSKHKFESGTGWPSFYQPLFKNHVIEITDSTYGMQRTEVICARCGGHLGHVFNDGPHPTGLRYCMNSVSLDFKKDKK